MTDASMLPSTGGSHSLNRVLVGDDTGLPSATLKSAIRALRRFSSFFSERETYPNTWSARAPKCHCTSLKTAAADQALSTDSQITPRRRSDTSSPVPRTDGLHALFLVPAEEAEQQSEEDGERHGRQQGEASGIVPSTRPHDG